MLDLFKFTAGSDPSVLEGGELINGATSIMWTERYRDPGEFEIEAPLSSGLRNFLPIDTLISHKDTYEVMVVENHHIKETPDEDPILQITGRSLEAYLENRIVGADLTRVTSVLAEYVLPSAQLWAQIRDLIEDHIDSSADNDFDLGNFVVTFQSGFSAQPQPSEERAYGRENLHGAVVALLGIENWGIRTIRRNTFGHEGSSTATTFNVYRGQDLSEKVIFSVKAGDLDSAEYLWSSKKYKNCIMVVGRYLAYQVWDTSKTGFQRKVTIVDGQHLDGHYDEIPIGATRTSIIARMTSLGRQELQRQGRLALTSADISEITKHEYRKDYNVGDIVMVDASYGQMRPMRVVEFSEIQDENEFKGHPTLEDPDPEG